MNSGIVPRPLNPPADLTIRDFKADRSLGRASFYGDIANAAATKICGLYGKSPATVVKTIPFGTGLIDNSKGLFDDLCEDIAPLPPPPAPPFTGGQCDAVLYSVTAKYRQYSGVDSSGNPLFQDVNTTFRVWGAIGALRMALPGTYTTQGKSFKGFKAVELFCRGSGEVSVKPAAFLGIVGASDSSLLTCSIVSVSRVGGAADNCGNPPPSYPLPSAEPQDLEGTTIINVSPTAAITVPVKIVPTFAPIANIFRPEFNVDVGGINVNISAGGFTFSPTVEVPVGVNFPVSDPRVVTPTPQPITLPSGSASAPTDLSPVLTRLNEIEDEVQECCDRLAPHPDLTGADFGIQVVGSGNNGIVDLPARTYRVTVTVDDPGGVDKSQTGDNSPDVIYAGWAWFMGGGGVYSRQPIDSPIKAYEVPPRSGAKFAFKLQKSYTCTVRAYFSTKAQGE